MSDPNPLEAFLPPARRWFTRTLGAPTPPQALGWPAIQRGEHTLILAPTGSGKTLAAFLWGINELYAKLAAGEGFEGIELLYISPLKALNNDIERNLRAPLAGIRQAAKELGQPLPALRVAVRTGDTPQSARAAMLRHPPQILITTPESLYLLLTSLRARDTLRTVRTVIVDEIHTLCGNKRGVHLALSLERLEALTGRTVQRIGLSATQKPLEEVARFLGGYEAMAARPGEWNSPAESERLSGEDVPQIQPGIGESIRSNPRPDAEAQAGKLALQPRPVTIVDAGVRKPLDLKVVTALRDMRQTPGGSIWSSIIPQVLDQVRRHRTTLVFANSRRQAERCADRLNEQLRAEQEEEVGPGGTEALSPGGVPKGVGMFGTGAEGPFRAHHGSISREQRLKLEQELKDGKLPALVGTSSLELGIDIGAVDLVAQLQSPKGIARGLQRVGRSGHLVGQTSVGRIYPTHLEDILESAAVARGMLEGDVEPTYTPQNCLDVLAQQITAMVAVEGWDVSALYDLVRGAYAYHALPRDLLDAVLEMLSGKYPSGDFRELRARIVWDRVHDQLAALPGTLMMALRNGGTIPDRGTFNVYLPDGQTKIGELDEEFVFETHPGDVFTLGSQTWRVTDITQDRVIVADAPGQMPRMPFWKGDVPYRDYHLGERVGEFRRLLAERVEALPPLPEGIQEAWPPGAQELVEWLGREYALDDNSARNAILYVQRQIESLGAISSDRTVILESFTDALGDARLVIHSCFGGRINSAWALALSHAFRERLGFSVEVQTSEDGILFRLPQSAERALPLDVVAEMSAAEARERLLVELPGSALFGAQFRVNAARAMLLPGVQGAQRRTPFWLQRLRAKDLLAVSKGMNDFPIVAETYRDCLRDILDLPHLQEVLNGIQSGDIRIVKAETAAPSPVAASLLFNFISIYMYEGDAPKVERQMQALALDRRLLGQLLDGVELADLLRPEAVREIEGLVSHTAEGRRARSREELALLLAEMGDLTQEEVIARSEAEGQAWLDELAASGRALLLKLPTENRWAAAENWALYRAAFDLPERADLPAHLLTRPESAEQAREEIMERFLRGHGPAPRSLLAERYGFAPEWLEGALRGLEERGMVVQGRLTNDTSEVQVCDRRVLERIHQRTLLMLRKEIQPVSIFAYADFLARWQHLHPAERRQGPGALVQIMQQLRGVSAPGVVWERDLLPLRLRGFLPPDLEELCESGELVWVGSGGKDPRRSLIRFIFRGEGALFLPPAAEETPELSAEAQKVLEFLRAEGACFFSDLRRGTGLAERALDGALAELAANGLATNDTLDALREILSRPVVVEGERAPLSSLEAELSAWRREHTQTTLRRTLLRRDEIKRAKREAARRLRGGTDHAGRWALVHRRGIWGEEVEAEARAARRAKQLLARYGIVTRASLAREEWEWMEIQMQLSLLEMRGEVRRGYFVQGLPGLQFATPDAVERLRGWAKEESAELTLMNATDPASPFGLEIPGAEALEGPLRVSRLPGNYLLLQRGRPIMAILNGGERIQTVAELAEETARQGLKAFLDHVAEVGGHRVAVQEWNGASPLSGQPQAILEALGFYREPPAMVWEG
jgi:ATP-dependent Lhr-like helicase